MRFRFLAVLFLIVVAVSAGIAAAQSRQPRQAPAPATVHGNMQQVMRGIFYINSNVIFAAQSDDPAAIPPADFPSTSPNALTSTYGGWTAVENAALALADAANLLTIPGRVCANNKQAPVTSPDWMRFVQGLKDVGMASYRAAQARDQEKIVDAAGELAAACANCHGVYRDEGEEKDCLPRVASSPQRR